MDYGSELGAQRLQSSITYGKSINCAVESREPQKPPENSGLLRRR
jgi:hypothetical protein